MIYPSNQTYESWKTSIFNVIPQRQRGRKAVKVDLIDLRDSTGLDEDIIYTILGIEERQGTVKIDDFGGIWRTV